MPRFFINEEYDGSEEITITGADAFHIARSLRLRTGEKITVCDRHGHDMLCKTENISDNAVKCAVLSVCENLSEPKTRVVLYQAMPKSEKMELIVQKATELGVFKIVPMMTARCVSRPDEKGFAKRLERLRRIAGEAAMQSGRGDIPEIEEMCDFKSCVKKAAEADLAAMLYEKNGEKFSAFLNGASGRTIAIMIGSEGGFSPEEAGFAVENGLSAINLGKRILRTETAPLCALSAIMYATGELE